LEKSQLPPFSVPHKNRGFAQSRQLEITMIRNPKAEMFNRKASDPKNKPDEVLKILGLQQRQKIADVGSGGGYFALRFAEIVGAEGRVFALDTNPKFLGFIQGSAKEKGLTNVETVLTEKDKPILREKSIDLVFMRNVCHHLSNRVEYFRLLKNTLKTNGRVAIIEYKSGRRFSFHRLFGHYVTKEKIIDEMKEAGYKLEKDEDFLPEQSFTLFSMFIP
jgi:ubiquinone/menaquinone biosynthesis C-methylase UbiE